MKTDEQTTAGVGGERHDNEALNDTTEKRRYQKPVICDFLQPAVAFGTSDLSCGPP